MDNPAKKAPQEMAGMVPIHGFTEAIHRGDTDIPFVDLGGGNLYQLLHVDMRLSLWVMRMKLQPGFEVQRHYHTGQVFAVTLSGKWLYKEYPEIVNVKGSYLFEPAHSVHTLYVPKDNTEITDIWFAIYGANLNVNDDGNVVGVDDARSALEGFRKLCAEQGVSCDNIIVHGLD